MLIDVAIVGGGPAGLSAALMLGRARKRVVLFNSGPPRNAAAHHIQGFLTRDGTPPAELRRIALEQLRPYENVEAREARVDAIARDGSLFRVQTASGSVDARRVLLCVGMVDEHPDLPGYRELWGESIFQCPYCHAWEIRDGAFGVVSPGAQWLEWAMFLKGWTRDVIAFTNGAFAVPADVREKLSRGGVQIEERKILGLRPSGGKLAAVQLEGGAEVARDALFVRSAQRQPDLVTSLDLALDEQGFVRVDDEQRTTIDGIYAAGDLTTPFQGALVAASAGVLAAGRLNHRLTMELVAEGIL